MKKSILYLLIILLNIFYINPVFANTETEKLQNILNLIPNEYNLDLVSKIEMDESKKNYYIFSNISKILEETNGESLYCSNKMCIFDDLNIQLYIENISEKYKLTLSNETNSITKELTLNLNYIESNSNKEQSINDAINAIKSKTNSFSDFDFSHINYEFITSPQILDETSEKYGVKIMNCAYAGSEVFSIDEKLVVPFHYDYIYFFKDEVLYKIVKDNVIIDTTKNNSQYFPTLDLNKYYDIEKYIDDVLLEFKERTGYNNSMIKNNSDGNRYKITSTTNESNSYEVKVINLDDNTEWTIYFSGKLKEKTNESLLGDINKDGKITITDVIKLLRIYLGLE